MHFRHADAIWADFPSLSAGALAIDDIGPHAPVDGLIAKFYAIAANRLDARTESELPEIQAWRQAFAQMGLKPTQYRSAAESLLRRFRKEGSLPRIHPLVDLCNSISLSYAIPIAVFDRAQVTGSLEVRYARGDERYESFGGDIENPSENEVVFVDSVGNAHSRRWVNRQSAASAVRDTTKKVLIVAEAVHDTAVDDVFQLIATVSDAIRDSWETPVDSIQLTSIRPEFVWDER